MIYSKQDLLGSGATRKRHADLVASSPFRAFVAVALAEYASRQSKLFDSPARGDRLQGAHEFVDVLMNLSDLPTRVVRKDHDNLPPE